MELRKVARYRTPATSAVFRMDDIGTRWLVLVRALFAMSRFLSWSDELKEGGSPP
jgi:hypothetical protein